MVPAIRGPFQESKPTNISSVVQTIQPLLIYEAILKPTSDLTGLANHLNIIATMHNLSFSDVVYEVIRGLLCSISQQSGLETLKIDSFVLIKLPILFEKLHQHFKGSESGPLKTPTDVYKAFDKLLKNEPLLDSMDCWCKANILQLLVQVVCKCSVPLLTETEREDILKRRQNAINNRKIKPENFLDEYVGDKRNFDNCLKAESKDILGNMLVTVEAVDLSKPESIENILDILCNIIDGESFNLLLASSAANGKLKGFVKAMVKLNQHSQESQGESVKNSLSRAALFDITFLMLIHIVQCFGAEVLSDAKDTFVHSWVAEMMSDSEASKSKCLSLPDNKVDNLLQQVFSREKSGELRTQVVKWQDICSNVHLAMADVLTAKWQSSISQDKYEDIVKTLSSKLCALPCCVVAWFANYRMSVPLNEVTFERNLPDIAQSFVRLALESLNSAQDMPYIKERVGLLTLIMNKMMVQSGLKGPLNDNTTDMVNQEARIQATLNVDEATSQSANAIKEILSNLWREEISGKGMLSIDTVWKLHHLFKAGGATWFTSVLTEELLKVVYQTSLDKYTDFLVAIFHIDIEQCTIALLLEVLPSYLQCKQRRERLADPHGTALAKLLIGCVFSALAVTSPRSGPKRKTEDEAPPAKMRRLTELVEDSNDFDSSETHSNSVQQALTTFFRLLQTIICYQDSPISPVTHFAFRILEQAALRSGLSQASKNTSVQTHKEPIKLFFQHVFVSLVLHLVKVVPSLFTSMGIVTKLFDISSQSGRKNIGRVLCLLRNINSRRPITS